MLVTGSAFAERGQNTNGRCGLWGFPLFFTYILLTQTGKGWDASRTGSVFVFRCVSMQSSRGELGRSLVARLQRPPRSVDSGHSIKDVVIKIVESPSIVVRASPWLVPECTGRCHQWCYFLYYYSALRLPDTIFKVRIASHGAY